MNKNKKIGTYTLYIILAILFAILTSTIFRALTTCNIEYNIGNNTTTLRLRYDLNPDKYHTPPQIDQTLTQIINLPERKPTQIACQYNPSQAIKLIFNGDTT